MAIKNGEFLEAAGDYPEFQAEYIRMNACRCIMCLTRINDIVIAFSAGRNYQLTHPVAEIDFTKPIREDKEG